MKTVSPASLGPNYTFPNVTFQISKSLSCTSDFIAKRCIKWKVAREPNPGLKQNIIELLQQRRTSRH